MATIKKEKITNANEDTAHFSILVWRIPIDREAWWTTLHGVAESRTWLSNEAHNEDIEKLAPSYIPGKNENGTATVRNSYGYSSVVLNIELLYDPGIPSRNIP